MTDESALLGSGEFLRAIRNWFHDIIDIPPAQKAKWPHNTPNWRVGTLIGYLEAHGYCIEPFHKATDRRYQRTRLARLANIRAIVPPHTEAQWQAILLWAGNACVCCGEAFSAGLPATKDHVIPLVHGGDDSIANIQPLCPRCNSIKGASIADHRKPGWWAAVQ